MNTFYVRHRGEIRGPIDIEKLRSLAAAGRLKPFHELAPSAEGPWTRADKLLPSLPFTSHAANEAAPAEGAPAATPAPALHDAFISHSSKDKLSADAVCSALESRGIRCWVAPRDIAPGANWGEAIIDGLSHSRVVILILSQHANVSPQVMREVERAVSKGIPIVPLRIEDVPLSKSMEYFLSSAHWMDAFTPPLRKHLDGLVQRVAAMISAEAAVTPRRVPAGPAPAVGRSVTGRATILGGMLLGALVLGVATWLALSRRHAAPLVEDVAARKPAPQAADSTGTGTAPQTSTTATYGDGRRREFFTFADGSKAKLDFPPGRSRPSATLVAADGKPFTGDAGLTLGVAEGKVRVVDVDVDGAASRAGIAPGDMVVAIAEAAAKDFVPFPPEETVSAEATRLRMLAGREGSKARLKIERAGADPARIDVVELTRSGKYPEFTIREKRFVTGLDRSVEFSDGSRLEVVARSGGNEEQHVVIGQDGQRLAANLGMTCLPDDSGLVVAMVTEDGPAAKAGVRQGDHVIGVAAGEGDRFAPCAWSEAEAARWLWSRISHGTPGSKARLRLRRAAREPTAEPEIVTIARAVPGSIGPRPKAAKADWTNGLGMPFILVKPGTFFMGVSGWLARDDAPIHYVRISQPFLISAFEVTQADYAALDPEHVSAFSVMGTERLKVFGAYRDGQLPLLDTSNLPVDSVTWDEATAFCDTLSKRERVSYRLPTEAEWEYACRDAGAVRWDKSVDFDPAINQRAVCQASEFPLSPAVVGSRSPNDLGIYDMLGNVAEWCNDVYDPAYFRSASRVDPAGPAQGFKRVARGGGYDSQFPALFQRAGFATNENRASLGFRVVIPLAGDVGANETLKKLAMASARKPLDLSVIPNPLPIAALPVRSAEEEQEALTAFAREISELEPAAVVARIRRELPTFQRHFLSEKGVLGRYVPSAQRAIDFYSQGHMTADEDIRIQLLTASLEADAFLGWPANDVAWQLATELPEARRDADASIEHAIAACQASGWRYWGHLDTLAAALAAAGKHQRAVRIAEAVLPHAPEKEREEFQRLLDRYRTGEAHAPAADPIPTP